ncbi:MAG TPA: chalcone isomerase family protein [Burkholderiaceae bacterium]|jgi:hypothetical protein
MRTVLLALIASAALACQGARADNVEVDGVKYETSVNVAGQALLLNGAATKHNKQGVRNFAVGLYLSTSAKSADAVLAAPGAKRISFRFLKEVNADTMRFLTMGVEANMNRTDFAKTFVGVMRLGALLGAHPHFNDGDTFTFDYQPGKGTVFMLNGKPQGEPVAEPEFFKAMLLVWLGGKPVDPKMKTGLLGA